MNEDNFGSFLEEEKRIFDLMDDAAENQDWEVYDILMHQLEEVANKLL